jgi:hypothetical protein
LHTSKSTEKVVLEAVVSLGKHRTRIFKGCGCARTRGAEEDGSIQGVHQTDYDKEKQSEELFNFRFGSEHAKLPVKKGRVEKGWRFMFPLDCDLMMIDSAEYAEYIEHGGNEAQI